MKRRSVNLFSTIFFFTFFIFSGLSSVFGNNIRVEGKTRVIGFIGNDTALIEVKLLWDNSWRDDFNWDAAWVFFKYKKRGIAEPWHSVSLSSSGHELSPLSGNEGGGYTFMAGASGSRITGLYVMRDGISEGNVAVRIRVKWPLSGTGLSRSDFGENNDGLYVAVHAIEMVYVPYGAYVLGDGYSYGSFVSSDTTAIVMDSENGVTLHNFTSPSASFFLGASYPKGYAGFYVMKYEVSQEQYVEFLNSLTLDQQRARVGNNDFEHMMKGDYVFGDLKHPNCRNGIAFIEQRAPGAPAVFGNNLNASNDFFSLDDGQTLACNYVSIEDVLSYCSWSGLRLMSELEYEKACRRFYPQLPEAGEYAWNSSSGVNGLLSLSDLSYVGEEREQSKNYRKNVNSGEGNTLNGPVRCGLFAGSSTNQQEAGATYWGVMEMSGNVKELCVNVNYSDFDGGSSGTGDYNPSLWSSAVGNYGLRGGGFRSADSLLRTSDRTESVGYFSSSSYRDSTVGFRGVYSLSGIEIDGGQISAPDTGCWSGVNIRSVRDAFCASFPDIRFLYSWYVKKPGEAIYELIPHVSGPELNYEMWKNKTSVAETYVFKRVATCMVGNRESQEIKVTLLPEPFLTDVYEVNAGSSVEIKQYWGTNAEVTWELVNATNGIYIHSVTSEAVILAGGLFAQEFQLKGTVPQCPGESFNADIRVNNTWVYTGKEDSVILMPGNYRIECWGASGWVLSTDNYGKGGYVKGDIHLNNRKVLYIYVGGYDGYNGGGDVNRQGYSGGGATDIRLNKGVWNDFTSLKSRILIAAGGGGVSTGSSRAGVSAGSAGGLIGYNGTCESTRNYVTYGRGATQTAGGARGAVQSGWSGTTAGSFAVGGRGTTKYFGGGGGGLYGGGGAGVSALNYAGGGGGSSFISGHAGCDALSASSTASSIVHTGQPVHYSGVSFTNTVMIDGAGYQWTTVKGSKVNMPNQAGTGTMTGNTGNGQVKITPLL